MRRFSSLKKLKQASVEEIAEVPGIGPATASAIIAALAGQPAAQAVNMTTGEIIEPMGEQ